MKGFHLAMYSGANEAAKINRRQARRVYEILRYRCTPKVKNNKKNKFYFLLIEINGNGVIRIKLPHYFSGQRGWIFLHLKYFKLVLQLQFSFMDNNNYKRLNSKLKKQEIIIKTKLTRTNLHSTQD